ncbi:hypothetical protein ACFQ08_34790, partial [Streptosporangium algeriense]
PVQARATAGGVELRLPWLIRDLQHAAVSQLVCTAAAASDTGADPLIKVLEPGAEDDPWLVRCNESGTAVPVEQEGPS